MKQIVSKQIFTIIIRRLSTYERKMGNLLTKASPLCCCRSRKVKKEPRSQPGTHVDDYAYSIALNNEYQDEIHFQPESFIKSVTDPEPEIKDVCQAVNKDEFEDLDTPRDTPRNVTQFIQTIVHDAALEIKVDIFIADTLADVTENHFQKEHKINLYIQTIIDEAILEQEIQDYLSEIFANVTEDFHLKELHIKPYIQTITQEACMELEIEEYLDAIFTTVTQEVALDRAIENYLSDIFANEVSDLKRNLSAKNIVEGLPEPLQLAAPQFEPQPTPPPKALPVPSFEEQLAAQVAKLPATSKPLPVPAKAPPYVPLLVPSPETLQLTAPQFEPQPTPPPKPLPVQPMARRKPGGLPVPPRASSEEQLKIQPLAQLALPPNPLPVPSSVSMQASLPAVSPSIQKSLPSSGEVLLQAKLPPLTQLSPKPLSVVDIHWDDRNPLKIWVERAQELLDRSKPIPFPPPIGHPPVPKSIPSTPVLLLRQRLLNNCLDFNSKDSHQNETGEPESTEDGYSRSAIHRGRSFITYKRHQNHCASRESMRQQNSENLSQQVSTTSGSTCNTSTNQATCNTRRNPVRRSSDQSYLRRGYRGHVNRR